MISALFVLIAVVSTIVFGGAALLAFARVLLGRLTHIPVRHPGKCQNCQYVLGGLPRAGACPECSCPYDVDIPIDTKPNWAPARDARRTFLRCAVLFALPFLFPFLQYPITYSYLRLRSYSTVNSAEIAQFYVEETANAYLLVWQLIGAVALFLCVRVMSAREYRRTLALWILVPQIVMFSGGILAAADWSSDPTSPHRGGGLTLLAVISTITTVALICGLSLPRWIRKLESRSAVNFGLFRSR